jgi:hypothetical protein
MRTAGDVLNEPCMCGHTNARHIHQSEMGYPYHAECKECLCQSMTPQELKSAIH